VKVSIALLRGEEDPCSSTIDEMEEPEEIRPEEKRGDEKRLR